jgi:hypothetical protein
MSDDLIFWGGIPVGCVEGNHIVWFSHAPREAIEAYKQPSLDRSC